MLGFCPIMSEHHYTYILANKYHTTIYVGYTNDLERRLAEHRMGFNPTSFTSRYHVYKLLWYQEFSDPHYAIAAEKRIKKWSVEKKVALIKEMNPTFEELAPQENVEKKIP